MRPVFSLCTSVALAGSPIFEIYDLSNKNYKKAAASATSSIVVAMIFLWAIPLFCVLVLARTVERIPRPPIGFTKVGTAPPDELLTLYVGLRQRDSAGLERRVLQVSTPSHRLYGKHLSKQEVERYIRPDPLVYLSVVTWFRFHGIQPMNKSSAGDWLTVKVTVRQANLLFGTDLVLYRADTSNTTGIRALAYSVPKEVENAIDVVHPLTSFWTAPSPLDTDRNIPPPPPASIITSRNTLASRATPPSCPPASEIFPNITCFMELYGIPYTPATQPNNRIGVTGYIRQWAKHSDIQSFLSQYRPDISSPIDFTEVLLYGGTNPQDQLAGGEATMDLEVVMGMATNVPTTFISIGNSSAGQWHDWTTDLFDSALYFAGEPDPPQVISTSYGGDETILSQDVANRICNAYMQLAARGVSVLFCSGDGGVEGFYFTPGCTTYMPTFPSTCPYVTSVGATRNWAGETAGYFSSGGFSNYFARPSWQDSAVNSYLSALPANDSARGHFNESGRAFPDVSAQGLFVALIENGGLNTGGGTSESTPIVAAVVALLNDRLLAAGRSTLGWLNPWLYSTGAAGWNDIRTGSNAGCGTGGFSAAVGSGWDPVTGFGTPNFPALLDALGL